MGFFRSLVDRMKDKKDELQKRAAKKAAEVALERSAAAARGVLDSAGRAIEKALFGAEKQGAHDEPDREQPPDPFAKLKAAEERKARLDERDEEVDAELAALKKKLGK